MEFFLYPVVQIQARDEGEATDMVLDALFHAGVAQIPGWLPAPPSQQEKRAAEERVKALEDGVQASLDCLEEVLEDTDGPNGERIPNPLLVQLRAL